MNLDDLEKKIQKACASGEHIIINADVFRSIQETSGKQWLEHFTAMTRRLRTNDKIGYAFNGAQYQAEFFPIKVR